MAEHTPGPWTIDPATRNHDFPIREGREGFLIATVWHDDSMREESDARLIAAAPALLNALTRYRAQHDQQRWPLDRPCGCETCQQAAAAIAAAKGKP